VMLSHPYGREWLCLQCVSWRILNTHHGNQRTRHQRFTYYLPSPI